VAAAPAAESGSEEGQGESLSNPIHPQSRRHRSISITTSRSLSPPPAPVIKAIRIGQEFDDFKAFKIAMQDWTLSDPRKFTFRVKNLDRTRNTVVCVRVNAGCPFC